MPSDANGVFSLPSGSTAVTGETIQASTHNTPIEDIASAISQRLMRSGVAPMTGPLKIVDGAVGSPAVKFSTDGTTGFYKTTNGIGVSVGGTKVAEFTSSGLSWIIGMMTPWTLLSAPSGWVLPYGQTLSRTTYADLWTIAQTEISNGNTFYNNGNGTTTFGIGDMRGRVPAGKDDMGGTSAGRLTPPASGGVSDSTVLGSVGGVKDHTLTTPQIPSHSHANSLSDPGHAHTIPILPADSNGASGGGNTRVVSGSQTTSLNNTGITITNASTGGGGAHNNVQPTMICNYILYAGA